jgi:hypothetical protein
MKKVFKSLVLGLAIVGLVAGVTFAGSSYGTSDYASGSGYAADPDQSSSVSNWGWGNDTAGAQANGGGGFNVEATAGGKYFSEAAVWGTAKGYADTCSYAKDFGTTSVAGAKAEVDGWANAGGETFGFTNGTGFISGNTFFAGNISQNNYAAETGYAGSQGIDAGNSSTVSFENGQSFYDNKPFLGANYESGYTEGYAVTSGKTEVSIDATGDYKNVNGFTSTSSYFDTNHCGDSAFMAGSGAIGGQVTNTYGAGAGGTASFNYSGMTDGAAGGASLNATIDKTSHSTTVRVNAASYSSIVD